MPNVCHFIRKSSQLRASFINNQISEHIRYEPFIIYRLNITKEFDGGFSKYIRKSINLDLSENQKLLDIFLYKILKKISEYHVTKIQTFLVENNIEIAHFHYGSDCGVFYPVFRKLKIPTLVSFYGYDASSFPMYLAGIGKYYLKNRVFKNVTSVLAMSPDMKQDLVNAGCPPSKIIVHYYGTDVYRFYQSNRNYDKINPVLLNLCSLVPQKGQMFLLQSIKKTIARGVTNFSLRIVGAGELESELHAYVNDNDLTKHVSFIGAIPYGEYEMLEEYKNADIFLHPSVIAPNGDKEGIPGTIVEAMSAALPVISTFHAGIPYIIEDKKTGLLVKEHDVDSLSDAICLLISNRKMRREFGLSGQKYALEYLNLLEKEKELEAIYDNLIYNYK